uniref:Rieske domain-containing protein n=1 Tax=Ascaris lumbricoides TaxID=6252 RepID=A0A0M3IR81_ASCLU
MSGNAIILNENTFVIVGDDGTCHKFQYCINHCHSFLKPRGGS